MKLGKGERVYVGEHMGGCGYASICEQCADQAICEFLANKHEEKEEGDDD